MAENSEQDIAGLAVTMPLDAVDLPKLAQIIDVRGELIRHALGTDDLPVEVDADGVHFHWFPDVASADEIPVYGRFIEALCRRTKDSRRINRTKDEAANERYAFRCFLLQLGYIGPEYHEDRIVLMRKLSGTASGKAS